MVRLICGGLAALKLTKLFGINDFPAAQYSGKVLIIITYCYLIIIIIIIIIKALKEYVVRKHNKKLNNNFGDKNFLNRMNGPVCPKKKVT